MKLSKKRLTKMRTADESFPGKNVLRSGKNPQKPDFFLLPDAKIPLPDAKKQRRKAKKQPGNADKQPPNVKKPLPKAKKPLPNAKKQRRNAEKQRRNRKKQPGNVKKQRGKSIFQQHSEPKHTRQRILDAFRRRSAPRCFGGASTT